MNKLTKELLKKNNSREKAIFKENMEIYTNMVVYLRGSDLTDYNQELVRQDLIELILDGQERGDNIQKVMGGRYKEICDEIIDAMPKKTRKDKIKEYASMTLKFLGVLGVINIIGDFLGALASGVAQFNFILTTGDIITAFIIILAANLIVEFISKTALDTKNEGTKASFFKTWLIATAIFLPAIFCSIYFKTVVATFPLWVGAIIVLFIFIIDKIVSECL